MGSGLYTVQPSDLADGLMGIARRHYGSPARWPQIYEANRGVIGDNPCILRAGQQLALPGLAPEPPQAAASRLYRVDVADLHGGLRGLAARLLGDAERWGELYALNRGVIGDDPGPLAPGQWLTLP
jgi:nucleoid-associated protein YgaU